MVTQNIGGAAYQNNLYTAAVEKNTEIVSQIPANDEYAAVENENKNTDTVSLSTNNSKTLSTPIKIYADSVINNALDNIARGNNIEDNKRIVRLFSNLIKENPENILRKAYNL